MVRRGSHRHQRDDRTAVRAVRKKVPGDVVEIATGLATLKRGLALIPAGGDGHRGGRIIVTFLKALIEAAPAADKPATRLVQRRPVGDNQLALSS